MLEGKTKSGFKYSIDERIANDFRMVRLISKIESSDESEQLVALNDFVEFVLGKDGTEKFIAHVAKKNDGFVPTDKAIAEIVEILNSAKETKNS